MYNDYYGLKEKPFAAEPSPRFLVLMEEHQEALDTLVYAIDQQEGWALVVGEPGVGKTTLIIALLRELGDRVLSAVVTNPKLVPLDFLNQLALELGLEGPFASKGPFLAALAQLINRCRAEGKLILMVVDEAQDLSAEMLEELRLLGNLDNASPRVLNIFLVGQPEIIRVLKRSAARALMQRLHRSYALKPLTPQATATYVRQRLGLAGAKAEIFNPEGLAAIHEVSRGVPRLINSACDDALLLGFQKEEKILGREVVLKAAAEDPSLDWPPSDEFVRSASFYPPPGERPSVLEPMPTLERVAMPEEKPAPPVTPVEEPEETPAPPAAEISAASAASRAVALAAEMTGASEMAQTAAPTPQFTPPVEPEARLRPQPEPEAGPALRRGPRPDPRLDPRQAALPPRRAPRPGPGDRAAEEVDRLLRSTQPKRRGIFSRMSSGLSREAPGSLAKRIIFLLVLLGLLGGGYWGVKKAWPLVRNWVSGPKIEIPEVAPEAAKAAPKAKEGPIDWGPTLKIASTAKPQKEGRRGQNE